MLNTAATEYVLVSKMEICFCQTGIPPYLLADASSGHPIMSKSSKRVEIKTIPP
jgi:hypothetical protein